MREDLQQIKQRISLLEYVQQHHWSGRRAGRREEFVGLCPLHPDTRPSFYVNAHKNLFYCHGCQRGGDLIRFVELSERLSFRDSLARLKQQVDCNLRGEITPQNRDFLSSATAASFPSRPVSTPTRPA